MRRISRAGFWLAWMNLPYPSLRRTLSVPRTAPSFHTFVTPSFRSNFPPLEQSSA